MVLRLTFHSFFDDALVCLFPAVTILAIAMAHLLLVKHENLAPCTCRISESGQLAALPMMRLPYSHEADKRQCSQRKP
jgi:hypothetical protein